MCISSYKARNMRSLMSDQTEPVSLSVFW